MGGGKELTELTCNGLTGELTGELLGATMNYPL